MELEKSTVAYINTEHLQKLDAMAKPRSEEAIKKAEERKKQRKDKDLLLKDLCARLPYGVICQMEDELIISDSHFYDCNLSERYIELFRNHKDFYIKPYLRPLSSMTEEEKREIYDWLVENDVDWFDFSKLRLDEILISFDSSWLLINWLNAHHFDYRGLIEKGLAIEAPEGMYK